tara:strand:+ start:265 stop:489 length:225 start_codon:yes stop_codon:yes gene_type:complete
MESMEDKVEKITLDQEKQTKMSEEISEAYLSKSKEATLAYYLNNIAQSLQRECGVKPPHSASKVAEDSTMDKYY